MLYGRYRSGLIPRPEWDIEVKYDTLIIVLMLLYIPLNATSEPGQKKRRVFTPCLAAVTQTFVERHNVWDDSSIECELDLLVHRATILDHFDYMLQV